jgi:hypothetical protein
MHFGLWKSQLLENAGTLDVLSHATLNPPFLIF